ncbi:MAG: single-stranded DNA-binding protein [Methylobacter sp.]
MAINCCVFMGNFGQDPDLRYLPDGTACVNISIACGEKWKDKVSGEVKEHTEWIRAVIFGKRAEVVAQYFKKGSQIHVTGKQRTRSYDKDGVKHYATEILVNEFQFCGQRSEGGGDARASQQASAYGQGQQRRPSASQGNSNMPEPPPNYADFDDPFDDQIPF